MPRVLALAFGFALATAPPIPRVEVLNATGGLPAHISGVFQEPTSFQQAKTGRYYVFDRRAHAVFGIDPDADAPRRTFVDRGIAE